MTPARAARLILISLAAAWAFYSLVLLSMTLVMPRAALLSHSLPTAAAFQAAFNSPLIGNLVLFAALLGLISTWNALFFSATRILFVLSEDGYVGTLFRRLHPRFSTPTVSIVTVGLLIPVCAFFGQSIIGPLLNLFSVVMSGIYASVCLGVLKLRRGTARANDRNRVMRRWLPYLALGACMIIAIFASIAPLRAWSEHRFPIEWLVLAAWSACGLRLVRSKPRQGS